MIAPEKKKYTCKYLNSIPYIILFIRRSTYVPIILRYWVWTERAIWPGPAGPGLYEDM